MANIVNTISKKAHHLHLVRENGTLNERTVRKSVCDVNVCD